MVEQQEPNTFYKITKNKAQQEIEDDLFLREESFEKLKTKNVIRENIKTTYNPSTNATGRTYKFIEDENQKIIEVNIDGNILSEQEIVEDLTLGKKDYKKEDNKKEDNEKKIVFFYLKIKIKMKRNKG